ncbi:hypothetical protein PH562_16620 [Rhizobium sp. CNPSo 4062]|uniref:hypothetical protein n=1 Tax=Rhizobium sp. CNPSo 4062 TaxID=3021410 RepID=UPI00254DBD13|nr:hypothetical protein [Rhizobium sp. CNPSo 4062]MDK4703877.1 hypothetical protein [Rhizobium sp. CNPSo 4062]
MSTAVACFLIAIITGAFFGTGILLIRRIKPKAPDSTNTGAVEGDDRSFRDPNDGD